MPKPKDDKEKQKKEKLKKLREQFFRKPKLPKYSDIDKEILKLEFLSTYRSIIPRGVTVTELTLTLKDGSKINLLEPVKP